MSEGFATGIYPGDLTADDGGPRRGSLQDFGGATIENEDPLPDEATMPCADMLNGLQRAAAAHEKAVFSVGISVTFDGSGAPVVSQVTGPSEAAILTTITPHDDGTGNTSLTWPANTFPASILGPTVTLNEDVAALAPVALLIANGVRVKTRNDAGVLTNIAFTVIVY